MLNLKRTSAMACAQLRRNAPTRSRILSTKNLSTESCQPHIWVQNRQFTQSTVVAYARKASQDRNSINRESLEYSRSGSDDKTAALDDAAFNPDITDPDSQKKKAGEDSEQNPLDVSPANPKVSTTRDPSEGGGTKSPVSAGDSSERKRSSGGGNSPKGKEVS